MIILLIFFAGQLSCFVKANEIKIGFVFILTTQRKFGSFQQLTAWKEYFEKVPKSRYAVIAINWPFGEEVPSFIDVVIGHETDYGRVQYIESFLDASQRLIKLSNVSGVIPLSGSCFPVRPFSDLYQKVSPILALKQSILGEVKSTKGVHNSRYYAVTRSRVELHDWWFHRAQGYCLHQSLVGLILQRWKKVAAETKGVMSLDEHFVSYFLRSFDHENSSFGLLVNESLNSLQRMDMMYLEWPAGVAKAWSDRLAMAEVKKIRENNTNYFFMRKVLETCKIDPQIIGSLKSI